MKVVHVIGSIDPAFGGPPGVVMRIAAAQAAKGHNVHIVSYADAEAEPRIRRALLDVPGILDVERHLLPEPGRSERILALATRRPLTEIIAGADAVHLHGVWEPILRQAANVARSAGIPYCVRLAGMLDPWSLQQKYWKKRIALALGYRRMLDEAAFIHVLNDDEARLLAPLNLRAPTRTIPNGIFLDEIEPLPPKGSFSNQHSALAGRRFVLFLSRLHTKKGLDYLVDAYARLAPQWPDVDLVIAGPDDGAEASLRSAIATHGLGKRVHLVGGLYGREKLEALCDAACFCLPSRQEGFSVAITEALACGAPVVISKECHFPEVAAVGAGMVVDLNAEAVASALSAILADAETAEAMRAAGRALVRQRFTWPVIADMTLNAYALARKPNIRVAA